MGDYQLLDQLAAGGMALVGRARRVRDGADVVVKQLLPELKHDVRAAQMMRDEGHLGRQLTHPNIIRTLDVVELEGRPALVLELIDGADLAQIIRGSVAFGPFPVDVALAITALAAEGLHAAHEAASDAGEPLGVVHRDVSPHNIILSREGDVKVADFGVARMKDRTAAPTKTGEIKGKVAYLAPEMLLGEEIDRRVDIWGLGLILFEMLEQRRAYEGKTELKIMNAIVDDPAPVITRADVPTEVRVLLKGALARDPEQRFQTAGQVADAARSILGKRFGGDQKRAQIASLVVSTPTVAVDDVEAGTPTTLTAAATIRVIAGQGHRQANIELQKREAVSRFAEYLEMLPDGLDSYPDHRIKGSFLRQLLAAFPRPLDLEGLPDEIVELIQNPPPANVFIPEAKSLSVNLIARDQFFDDVEYLRWCADINREVLSSRLYRALFVVVRPRTIIKQGGARWSSIHQGIVLESTLTGDFEFEGRLRFPTGLVHPLFLLNWRDVFPIGLAAAGAVSPWCELVTFDDTSALYKGGWSR